MSLDTVVPISVEMRVEQENEPNQALHKHPDSSH